MTKQVEGQVALQDLGIWSSKMLPASSVVTKEPTSKPSSRKSSGSQNRNLPMFLFLRKESGQKQDASWETLGALLGDSTMHNTGAYHKDGRELLYSPISTDIPLPEFCLALNIGESPREEMPTYLSDILEENADPKYNLSPKACQGILNRAKARGKELPEILRIALEKQAQSLSRNEQGGRGGKGILIQNEHVGALSTLDIQRVLAKANDRQK